MPGQSRAEATRGRRRPPRARLRCHARGVAGLAGQVCPRTWVRVMDRVMVMVIVIVRVRVMVMVMVMVRVRVGVMVRVRVGVRV